MDAEERAFRDIVCFQLGVISEKLHVGETLDLNERLDLIVKAARKMTSKAPECPVCSDASGREGQGLDEA